MRFEALALAGAWLLRHHVISDERGRFARTFDREGFAERGLNTEIVQANVSFTSREGTLRGMHYQADPHGEPKLIRCTRGAIYDVLVDVRTDSPTRGQWVAVELNEDSGTALFAPAGVAHGFQTLRDGSEVAYEMFAPYVPRAATGVRFDDTAFAITWPEPPLRGRIISERDLSWPDWVP